MNPPRISTAGYLVGNILKDLIAVELRRNRPHEINNTLVI